MCFHVRQRLTLACHLFYLERFDQITYKVMADHSNGDNRDVDKFFDSSLESVDAAEELVIEIAKSIGFDEDGVHELGMAIREAMVNAVVHGNCYSLQRKVHFRVGSVADRITVSITDQGDGFEPRAVADPLEQGNLLKQSGRGILLIQAFVDEVNIRRVQPHGTEVVMTKFLSRP
jgi:serine/threonine-protein kinase RsbW